MSKPSSATASIPPVGWDKTLTTGTSCRPEDASGQSPQGLAMSPKSPIRDEIGRSGECAGEAYAGKKCSRSSARISAASVKRCSTAARRSLMLMPSFVSALP